MSGDILLSPGVFVAGWLIVTATVPPIARFCHRRGLLDLPGARKVHEKPTPRLTGVSLFLGLWGSVALLLFVYPERMTDLRTHALPVYSAATLTLLIGIWDDVHPIGGWFKLAAQVVAGIPLVIGGVGFSQVWVPFIGGVDLGWLSAPVTMVWFLVLVNAINIIDGVDGLATAVTAIATLAVIWVAWVHKLPPIWLASVALLGTLSAFWRFNRAPAKVFMGDSGSLTLGCFFAIVALLAPIKRFTALAFFVPLIALLLPLGESILSILRRSVKGGSPLQADVGHLHHMLLNAGWRPNQVVALYSVITAMFGAFCVAYGYINRRWLTLGLVFFVLLLGVGLAIILGKSQPGPDAQSGRPAREE